MPTLMTGMIQTPTMMTRNLAGVNVQLQTPQTPPFGAASGLGFSSQEGQILQPQFTGVMPGKDLNKDPISDVFYY